MLIHVNFLVDNSREFQLHVLLHLNLKFFYLHDDGTLEEHDFTRDGEYLVFETDHLSEWLIFSDYNSVSGSGNYALLIILPILLAIATMGFALIVIGKNRKKETD